VLGSATTQLYRNLSFVLSFEEGDEIVISKLDHEANIASWLGLAERQKLKVKWWAPETAENPKLQASQLDALLTDRTRLVCCTHVSNILGMYTYETRTPEALSKAVLRRFASRKYP
jgi:selenocysteine lyase/cysteine desulfurase